MPARELGFRGASAIWANMSHARPMAAVLLAVAPDTGRTLRLSEHGRRRANPPGIRLAMYSEGQDSGALVLLLACYNSRMGRDGLARCIFPPLGRICITIDWNSLAR